MHVFLVRHAQAGQRQEGHDDFHRPLSERGEARALELVSLFDGTPVGRVLSSPAIRCIQTVSPLARIRGLEVEEYPVFWEDAYTTDALAVLEQFCAAGNGTGPSLVACSHGNIIPELVDVLSRRGVPVRGHGCEKGSVWALTFDADGWTDAQRVKKKASSLLL